MPNTYANSTRPVVGSEAKHQTRNSSANAPSPVSPLGVSSTAMRRISHRVMRLSAKAGKPPPTRKRRTASIDLEMGGMGGSSSGV
jgi:hypothetical protein